MKVTGGGGKQRGVREQVLALYTGDDPRFRGRQSAIARHLGVSRQRVSQLVSQLEEVVEKIRIIKPPRVRRVPSRPLGPGHWAWDLVYGGREFEEEARRRESEEAAAAGEGEGAS